MGFNKVVGESEGGAIGQIVIDRTFPYQNTSPVETLDTDTGVIASALGDGTVVNVSVIFTIDGGDTYVITIQMDNDVMQLQPNLHQLRAAEPVAGNGDVAIASWIDGVTGTYHYSLDVDGNGKTLNTVAVSTRTLTLQY